MDNALTSYLQANSGAELARRLGVTPTSVSEWKTGRKTPDPERCVAIEQITNGEVTRIDLRPDDWHRIWPELAAAHPDLVPRPAAEARQEAAEPVARVG